MTVEPISTAHIVRTPPGAQPPAEAEFKRALTAQTSPRLRPIGRSGAHELRSGVEIDPTMMALAELSGAAPARATVAQAKSDQVAQGADAAPKPDARGESLRPKPVPGENRSTQPEFSASRAPDQPISQPGTPKAASQATLAAMKQAGPAHAANSDAPSRNQQTPRGVAPLTSTTAAASAAAVTTAPSGKIAAPASSAPFNGVIRIGGVAAKGIESSAAGMAKPAHAARLLRHADPEAFAAQVSRGLAAALRQNGGTVTIRMQPEALGDLRIRMGLGDGKVAAAFEVETEQARQLLGSSMDMLRSALEARGLSVDRLEVRVSDAAGSIAAAEQGREAGGAGVSGDGSAGRQDAGREQSGAGLARMPSDREPEPVEPAEMQGPWMGVEWGGALRLDALA
jgi:flagellar hook-length control protein FliK